MKKQFIKPLKTTFFVLSFLGMTCFLQSMSPANQVNAAELTGYSTANELNIRANTNTESDILAEINAGDSVEILGSSDDWYKVKVNEATGYVKKIYISTENVAYAKEDKLNVRVAADKSSESIMKLNAGDSVTVLSESGDWTKVEAEGKIGYIKSSNLTYQLTAYCKGSGVNFRMGLSQDSKSLDKLNQGDEMTVLAKVTDRYKVRYNGKIGFVAEEYITFDEMEGSGGVAVVEYAKQFLGNRYVFGGTSLTNGTDCSGFTMGVYRHFGYSLPRTSSAQRSVGTKVNGLANAKPGDLICYSGHVAIYMGNNMIIHASNAKDGIKISYNAAYRNIVAIRRIIN